MFAVVEINKKQYMIEEGSTFTIDGNIDEKSIKYDKVLLIKTKDKTIIGEPYLNNVFIEANVIESGKREKDIVFKFKRKTGYKLTKGHRQNSTLIRVKTITVGE